MSTSGVIMTSDEKYEKYKQLLLEACQAYTAKARSTCTCHCATKALLHQMTDPNDLIFDVNMDVDMLMAYRLIRTSGNIPTQRTTAYDHYPTSLPHQHQIVPYQHAKIVDLKKEFAKIYDGKSQIQEVIPKSQSELFPIHNNDLKLLHQFAAKNLIYYDSFVSLISTRLLLRCY